MLDQVLGVVDAATSGGILGLIGTGVHAFVRVKEIREKNRHELEMRRLDLEEIEREAELRMRETEIQLAGQERLATIEADAARDVADVEALKAAYQADRATYGIRFVDAIRGLMRPTITVYTLVLMTWIGWLLYKSQGETIPQAAALWSDIVNAIIMLTTTAVTWWFGSRGMRNSGAR